MFHSSNGETVEKTDVDKEVQGVLSAEAIPKDSCAGTASGPMVGEADMASESSELESTVNSMSKEIAKSLAEHYSELTQYAVVMSGIIDTLNNKAALQSKACEQQKMVEDCYKTETHEPLNCMGSVHQFVQCMRDYTQTVFDTLENDEEPEGDFDYDN